jgi:hypothetical protein
MSRNPKPPDRAVSQHVRWWPSSPPADFFVPARTGGGVRKARDVRASMTRRSRLRVFELIREMGMTQFCEAVIK